MVELVESQNLSDRILAGTAAVLTVLRTYIGFIFKIRYHCNCLSAPVGFVCAILLTVVSSGSRVKLPNRDGVWAADTVWKIRACGKRVTETHGQQHARAALQTLNKLNVATNKEPCLA